MSSDTSPLHPRPSYPRLRLKRTDRRLSLLVLLICCGLYLPVLGSYGMFDPWETHYTEVARQFMERNDWLSPYWHNGTGPEGWSETDFWSKPVGSFWMSGLSLKLLGYGDRITLRGTGGGTADDRALPTASAAASAAGVRPHDPGEVLTTTPVEWAVRLPFFLCGLFGIYCIYLMCARLFNRRTGVLAAIVLATSPMYFQITRQAMTDIPYVALMGGGIALFMLAVFGEREPLRRREACLGRWQLSWPHDPSFYLFIATFLLVMILQMRWIVPPLLRVPLLSLAGYTLSAALWMLIYAAMALLFLWISRKTETRNEVYLYTFYLVTAVAGLAKGFIGALQPGLVILIYLLASGEWRVLRDAALGRGLLLACAVFAPWWHAMVARHGMAFWSSLIGTEQLQRLTIGEQAQAKGTWEYYLGQFAYGAFPWIALLPAALARAIGRGWGRSSEAQARSGRDRTRLFLLIWLVATAALFTLSLTKYHHYILPALLPTAVLVAQYLDRVLSNRTRSAAPALVIAVGLLVLVALDLVVQPARWVWMYTYLYEANWARGVPGSGPLLVYALVCAALLMAACAARLRRVALFAFVATTIGLGGYVLSAYQMGLAPHWSQKYVIQTYYRLRKGPQEQLVAWQFNWRGETWHTAAQVVVAKSTENAAIQKWLRERPGRRFFFITERSRYEALRSMLPTDQGKKSLRIVDDSNVHYVLAEARI